MLDSRVQDLMNRIEMFIDPELEKLGFIGTAPIRLTVYLKDGSIHHLSNDLAQGNPEKPLTLEQCKNKFTSCLRTAGCFNHSQKWWSILESLEKATYETISLIGKV
ncbi:MAG: MmgE/PrpD family protein [Burkholderiaceae bacterium]|nr:MmgE/PrpD family protein [Burkholderiaceae bacterium]